MAAYTMFGRAIRGGKAQFPATQMIFSMRPATAGPHLGWMVRRGYSAEGGSPVEPPDYLSEGERKVFDLIKDRLKPEALEVCEQPLHTSRTMTADRDEL